MVLPERSGGDLLMQSAGLLILCHTPEETTKPSMKIPVDLFVERRLIRITELLDTIVRTVKMPVKQAVADRPYFAPCSLPASKT
jgi:hypothetical protein